MPAEPRPPPPTRGGRDAGELLTHVRAWSLATYGSPPVFLSVQLQDGSTHTIAGRGHTPDFRSVLWDGVTYYFTEAQAAVVQLLWLAIPMGGDVGGLALLAAAKSDGRTVDKVFRLNAAGDTHPAWKTMIIGGHTKGSYRLAE